MQAYIALSYSKRKELQSTLDVIKEVLLANSVKPFVFIEEYIFSPLQEKEMMQTAFAAIDKCDMLIAEVSDQAIGIGIEVGYAKAIGKPIIYLRTTEAKHSTTTGGTADHSIIYSGTGNLQVQLEALLKQIALS